MSAAHEILAELSARGIHIRAEGGKIRYRPVAALSPELKVRVLAAKPELLRLLAPASPPTLDQGIAVTLVLGFQAALLTELPLPTTLVLDVLGVDGLVTVATHYHRAPATFGPDEWQAMVAAAEADRAWPGDFAGWVRRKRTAPRWRLSSAEALGPVLDGHPRGWTVGAVLDRLGVTLRVLVIEGEG